MGIANIYAPNDDKERVDFLILAQREIITRLTMGKLIIGGDRNLAIKPKGREFSPYQEYRSRTQLKEFMQSLNMIDIWRQRNRNKSKFTFKKSNPKSLSRIDYCLISAPMEASCTAAKIL